MIRPFQSTHTSTIHTHLHHHSPLSLSFDCLHSLILTPLSFSYHSLTSQSTLYSVAVDHFFKPDKFIYFVYFVLKWVADHCDLSWIITSSVWLLIPSLGYEVGSDWNAWWLSGIDRDGGSWFTIISINLVFSHWIDHRFPLLSVSVLLPHPVSIDSSLTWESCSVWLCSLFAMMTLSLSLSSALPSLLSHSYPSLPLLPPSYRFLYVVIDESIAFSSLSLFSLFSIVVIHMLFLSALPSLSPSLSPFSLQFEMGGNKWVVAGVVSGEETICRRGQNSLYSSLQSIHSGTWSQSINVCLLLIDW